MARARFYMVLYSPHAFSQMLDRRISQLDVNETLNNPDRTYPSREGRIGAEKLRSQRIR